MTTDLVVPQEVLEKIPDPTGWRLMVAQKPQKEQTKGGILLPQQTRDDQDALSYGGQVVKAGPLAYRHDKFEGGGPWCAVGDWVTFARYGGNSLFFDHEGTVYRLRLINDDDVTSTAPSIDGLRMGTI